MNTPCTASPRYATGEKSHQLFLRFLFSDQGPREEILQALMKEPCTLGDLACDYLLRTGDAHRDGWCYAIRRLPHWRRFAWNCIRQHMPKEHERELYIEHRTDEDPPADSHEAHQAHEIDDLLEESKGALNGRSLEMLIRRYPLLDYIREAVERREETVNVVDEMEALLGRPLW